MSAANTLRGVRLRGGRRTSHPRRPAHARRPVAVAVGYLCALTVAEAVSTLWKPQIGLGLHAATLIALLIHGVFTDSLPTRRLLLTLSFAPLIRVLSYALPLADFPQIYWYVLTSVPLFVSAYLVARTLGLTRASIGLTAGQLPIQGVVALSGLLFGYAEYRILQPEPLAKAFTVPELWLPALILLVCTGFLEELLFRGVLQRVATEVVGRFSVLYVAILFAVLHLGYQSLLDVVFVFGVGLFFGWAVMRTGSLLGVTLSHGLTNILLFLVVPLAPLPAPLAIGAAVSPALPEVRQVPTLAPPSTPTLAPVATPTPRPTEAPIAVSTAVPTAVMVRAPVAAPSTPVSSGPASSGRRARITTDAVKIRLGPGSDYTAAGMAWNGQTYQVVGRNTAGDWLQICCPINSENGWVLTALTDAEAASASMPSAPEGSTPTPEAAAAQVTVVFERLNVRSGPGTDYPAIAEVHLGDQFAVTARDSRGKWWKVCCVSGNQGWVAGGYIAVSENGGRVPVEPIAPPIPATPTAGAPRQ